MRTLELAEEATYIYIYIYIYIHTHKNLVGKPSGRSRFEFLKVERGKYMKALYGRL